LAIAKLCIAMTKIAITHSCKAFEVVALRSLYSMIASPEKGTQAAVIERKCSNYYYRYM
jgi:hypothetical protein